MVLLAVALRALGSLEELWLGGNPVTDLTPLLGLASLTGIDLEGIDPHTSGVDQLRQHGVYVGGLA